MTLSQIKKFSDKLPKFPDGRIDYSNSKIAPVITVFIKYQDRILLLKRSDKVSNYHGKWNTVSGYLDEVKPVKNKILEELKEELSIQEDIILNIQYGKYWKLVDKKINKTWLIYPVMVELKKKPLIKLDWEHTDCKWIRPEEISKFDIVTKLDKSLKNALIKKYETTNNNKAITRFSC